MLHVLHCGLSRCMNTPVPSPPSLHHPTFVAMGSASELEMNDLWFSLAVESDVLAGGKGAKPLTGGAGGQWDCAGLGCGAPHWACESDLQMLLVLPAAGCDALTTACTSPNSTPPLCLHLLPTHPQTGAWWCPPRCASPTSCPWAAPC